MLQTLKKYPIRVSFSKGLDAVSIVQPLINTKSGFDIMEIWKPIKDFPDYKISNKGKVLSKARIINLSNGWKRLRKAKILKSTRSKRGYLYVGLYKNKIMVVKTVHRLVLEAFIPNPLNKLETNHKNGIKDNNLSSNLEWNTRSENAIHAYKTGLTKPQQGENRYNAKLLNNEVLEIRKLLKEDSFTKRKIGKLFGVSGEIIYNIYAGKNYNSIR